MRCPICQQVIQGQSTAEWPHYPFRSRRCQLIDLGRWLGEDYCLPVDESTAKPPHEDDATHPS